MNSENDDANAFIWIDILRRGDKEKIRLSISQPVMDDCSGVWSCEWTTDPSMQSLEKVVHGADGLQCMLLSFKLLRELIVDSDDLDIHPDFGSLNTALPEFLDFSFGDDHYNEQAEAVQKIQMKFQADLTRRRKAAERRDPKSN